MGALAEGPHIGCPRSPSQQRTQQRTLPCRFAHPSLLNAARLLARSRAFTEMLVLTNCSREDPGPSTMCGVRCCRCCCHAVRALWELPVAEPLGSGVACPCSLNARHFKGKIPLAACHQVRPDLDQVVMTATLLPRRLSSCQHSPCISAVVPHAHTHTARFSTNFKMRKWIQVLFGTSPAGMRAPQPVQCWLRCSCCSQWCC